MSIPLQRLLSHVAVCGVLAAAALSAAAAPVSFTFSGLVTDDPFGTGLVAFEGVYTFDSAAPDAVAAANTGSYTSTGGAYGIAVSFDGGTASEVIGGMLNIGIANNFAGPVDQYTVTGLAPGRELGLFFEDTSATVFGSDALPLLPPALAAFSWRQLRWFAPDIEILGVVNSLQCVAGCDTGPTPLPEPGTLVLAAAAALALRRHRRR